MPNQNLAVVIKAKDELSSTFTNMTNEVKSHALAMGAAFTAVGAAGLKLVDDSLKMSAQLGVTAITIGSTKDELRKLTVETSNVTFPIEEVTKSFDLLARAGVTSIDAMAKTATAFDTLGDAIGKNASDVTRLLTPAYKAFGEEMPQSADELDNFTWLCRNTIVELDEFSNMMRYTAADLDDLNITMDDSIAILAAMEAKGITGTAALREFRTAATQAANEGKSLAEALGLTSDELQVQYDRMASAKGMTQEYADAANEQYSIMDKLKQQVSEMKLEYSAYLEPFEMVFAGMTALGPAMMTVAIAGPKLAAAIRIVGTSFKSLLGPIGLVTVAIGAAAAAFGVFGGKSHDTKIEVKDLSEQVDELEEKFGNLHRQMKSGEDLSTMTEQEYIRVTGTLANAAHEAGNYAEEIHYLELNLQAMIETGLATDQVLAASQRRLDLVREKLLDTTAATEAMTTAEEKAALQEQLFAEWIGNAEENLSAHKEALTQSEDQLDTWTQANADAKAEVQRLEDAIRSANDQILGLAGVDLTGTDSFADQLHEVDMQLKQIELDKLQGVIDPETADAQTEALRNQRRELELMRDLSIGDQQYQLQELAEEYTGTGAAAEESFEGIAEKMRKIYEEDIPKLKEDLSLAEETEANSQLMVDFHQLVVDEMTQMVKDSDEQFKKLEAASKGTTDQMEQHARNVEQSWEDALGAIRRAIAEAEGGGVTISGGGGGGASTTIIENHVHIDGEELTSAIVDRITSELKTQGVF